MQAGICFLCLLTPAQIELEEFRLANGLKVIIRSAERGKTTALLLLFDVGGDHDPKGKSGMAHLVEHLFCVAATDKSKARTTEELMQRYPRGHNAQTSDRYTVYAAVFPSAELDAELADAAARLSTLRIATTDLQQELPRMQIELANMFGGMPALAAANHARERLRPTPQNGRKGGIMDHLQAITLADVHDRWSKYYKPCNATLVLCGGLGSDVRRKITDHFGAIPPGEKLPAAQEPGLPRFGSFQQITVPRRIPKAQDEVVVAYRPPLPTSPDYAPFLVLFSRLLAQQRTLQATAGRFPVYFPLLDDPHCCSVALPLTKPEVAAETVERIKAFVRTHVEKPLENQERTFVHFRFGMMLCLREPSTAEIAGNPYGVAFALGRCRQLGVDPGTLKQQLASVTDADLRRVAKAVFADDRAVAIYIRLVDGDN